MVVTNGCNGVTKANVVATIVTTRVVLQCVTIKKIMIKTDLKSLFQGQDWLVVYTPLGSIYAEKYHAVLSPCPS